MWNRLLISLPGSGLRAGRPPKRAYALRVPGGLRRAIPVTALLGLLLGSRLAAQTPVPPTLVNQGQTIHINAQAVVTVRGGANNAGVLTNNGTLSLTGDCTNELTFTNNGTLSLAGNWMNRGSYQGTGTLKLVGGPQSIHHNGQAFGTVVLDGAGKKTWVSYAEISGALVLQKGVITPLPGVQVVMADAATIRGGSPDSYVNGPLFHRGNTGKKSFPIGKGGSYLPVDLDQISSSGTVPLVVGMEAFLDNPGAKLSPGIQWVSPTLHWQRTSLPGSGTFSGAFLTLHYGPEAGILETDHERLIVAEASQPAGPYQSAKGEAISGNASAGSVTSRQPVQAQSQYFTVGISRGENLAPRETMYFPNTFSPSATNPEEKVWKIYGSQLEAEGFLVRIYNRWGNLVYESGSLAELMQRGWDGYNPSTGKVESGGVYTYTLNGKRIGGEPFQKIGSIHLMP
jgi:hypothetical protein